MNAINDLWQQAVNYWKALSKREQWLCMAGGVAITFGIIWQGAYQPLVESRALAEQKLASSVKQLVTIKQQAEQIVHLTQGQPEKAHYMDLPLDQMVNQTAKEFGMTITGVRSQRDSLQVSMDTANFNQLTKWLVILEQQGDAEIRELNLTVTEKPGQVTVDSLRIDRG